MNLKTRLQTEGEELRKSLDIDTFGELMDQVIRKSDAALLVQKKAGEKEWTVRGAGCGAVMDFYIYLNALEPIWLRMLQEMDKAGGLDAERFAAAICDVLKQTLVKAVGEEASE